MGYIGFAGARKPDDDPDIPTPSEKALDELQEFIRKAPKQSGIKSKLIIREIYERHFGIHEYDENSSPADLMVMHPKENTSEWSYGYQRIRKFIWLEVYKETGMSLKDFFDMPREYTELVFRTISDRAQARNREPDPLQDIR